MATFADYIEETLVNLQLRAAIAFEEYAERKFL